MKIFNNNKKGFTLVEMIIYILIISLILVAITYYAIDIIGAKTKAASYQEVQHNARFAMRRLVNEIRMADDLNASFSTFSTHPGELSLSNNDSTKDPVFFDIKNERLRISQGISGPYYLTSDNVRVTNLVFEDLSVTDRTKNIKISITVEHVNPENRNDFEASVSMESTAVIREQED